MCEGERCCFWCWVAGVVEDAGWFLLAVADWLCPPSGGDEPEVEVTFGDPEPKARDVWEDEWLGLNLMEETDMANFETTIDNRQKVRARVSLEGGLVPVDSLELSVLSGDGSFSNLDNDGNPLPNEQVYLISGAAAGDTVYSMTIHRSGGADVLATVILHVTEAEITVEITFDAPESKSPAA